MICSWRNRFRQSREQLSRGQSLIELAISLPVILMLFVGMVEVTSACFTYLTLLDAATAGSRIGAVGAFYTNSQVLTMVEQTLAREGYKTSALVDVIIVRADVNGTSVANYSVTNTKGSGMSPVLTAATLAARLKSSDPACRVVDVEVLYNQSQVIGFPFFSQFIPNPIALRAYSVQLVQR